MKPTFHSRLINGPFDDPCLYVRLLREGRALLFDTGFTSELSARDILKISDVFISHTHMDHFAGFDNILRLHLRRKSALRLYGPAGFTDCVEGRLRSYTWNLTADYPLVIEVVEVNGSVLKKAVFRAVNHFTRENSNSVSFEGILLKDSFFTVKGEVFDHQIPCMAFRLDEDFHININKDRLREMNLPVGPWLGELKKAIRGNRTDAFFMIQEQRFDFSELRAIADITEGQTLSYLVDILGSEKNIKKAAGFLKGTDLLYIESYFLDKDKDKADECYHLTARDAGRIAREAGAKRIKVFHFSPRYIEMPDEVITEAQNEFNKIPG